MTSQELIKVTDVLMTVMQASVLVPMSVVWRRKRHFSPAIKLLSWYVYLSAFSVVAMKVLYPAFLPSNYSVITFFNTGKIILFGAVYCRVLASATARRLVWGATLVAVVIIVGVYLTNSHTGLTVGRIVQCAVLAGFALLYLEQSADRANQTASLRTWHSPMWLLSVGQLLYSAGTVTAFSFDYLSMTKEDQSWKAIVVALVGMVFNWFLTLAFLRAKRTPTIIQPTEEVLASQLISN